MSYYINVYLDPDDVLKLFREGYSLGLEKATSGTAVPVQWVSGSLQANQFNIYYYNDFGVFFTNTPLIGGQTIVQTIPASATLGTSYAYNNNAFFASDVPPVRSVQIGILQNTDSAGVRTFGVSQTININGTPQRLPIAAANILFYGGSVVFQPSDNLTIYFSKSAANGFIYPDSPISQYGFSVIPGVPTYLTYSKGVWTSAPKDALSQSGGFSGSLSAPPTWYESFWFTLAASVDVSAFANWVETTLKNVSARSVGPAVQSAFVVEVISDKNRTAEILSLKGKWYETPLVHIPVGDGVEQIEGRRVKIVDVQSAITPFDELLKLLPSGHVPASRSHHY